jgi:hypothetical protein
MKFNRENVEEIRESIKEALRFVQEKHNILFDFDKITYEDSKFSCKLNCYANKDKVIDPARAEFMAHCKEFGYLETDFHKPFFFKEVGYLITGLKPANRKYPILATNRAGKQFKFPLDIPLRSWGRY